MLVYQNFTEGKGFNALNGEEGDLIEQGVIDPVNVTCTALRNAVSVAATVLTTEVVIVPDEDEIPKEVNPQISPSMMF